MRRVATLAIDVNLKHFDKHVEGSSPFPLHGFKSVDEDNVLIYLVAMSLIGRDRGRAGKR